ncbi:P2Y purinoceptor 4-like [Hydractinia symbiolongicarpus]|uniref:P2Y purinoceptor 4-like n=1 Tax=Hydractinia symbiolongicarpus TaxID=13093 RepID=UPI0025507AC7|nr:P2Y purinoceptor 4-like [Hydractinia symbiolongicarpus]
MNNSSCYNCTAVASTTPIGDNVISYEKVVQIAVHTFIFLIGLFGNSFVISTILCRKKMQTITNWFVFNIAISDIAIVVISLPITNLFPFISWPFDKTSCQYLIYPILEHFAGVSVLTHTALSLARYIAIRNSMTGKTLSINHARIAIVIIWLVSFLVMSSTLMGPLGKFRVVSIGGQSKCILFWASKRSRVTYRILIVTLTYAVPMTMTGFAYHRIHNIVVNSLERVHSHMSYDALSSRQRKSRRTDRVLMTMYGVFALTTLPLQLFYVVNDFGVIPISYGTNITWLLLLALFYTQVFTNPFILFYMSEDFRFGLYNLMATCCIPRPKLRRFSYMLKRGFKVSACHMTHAEFTQKYDYRTRSDKPSIYVMNGGKMILTPVINKKLDNANLNNENSLSSCGSFEEVNHSVDGDDFSEDNANNTPLSSTNTPQDETRSEEMEASYSCCSSNDFMNTLQNVNSSMDYTFYSNSSLSSSSNIENNNQNKRMDKDEQFFLYSSVSDTDDECVGDEINSSQKKASLNLMQKLLREVENDIESIDSLVESKTGENLKYQKKWTKVSAKDAAEIKDSDWEQGSIYSVYSSESMSSEDRSTDQTFSHEEGEIQSRNEINCLSECENSKDFMESTQMDKKLSRESITAYYDDGTLLYFYDPTVGKVSFDHDDGRETDI